MRVTEHRLMEMTSRAVRDARNRAAGAGQALSDGIDVRRASDDPTAWAEAARASARMTLEEGRGQAIKRASERMQRVDGAMEEISESLNQAYELTIQMSNDLVSDLDRAGAADQLEVIKASMIESMNKRDLDGTFLFSGSLNTDPAFAVDGNYQGDTQGLVVDGARAGLPGTTLIASDPFGTLDRLISELRGNSTPGVQAGVDQLRSVIDASAANRTTVGFAMERFQDAENSREILELHLSELKSDRMDADPILAASELAEAQGALETARAVAETIMNMIRQI